MKFNKVIKIEKNTISEHSPVFFIAEAGVNHNGSMTLAKKLIDIACEAGADAVKFQHFKTDELILKNVPKAPYQRVTTNSHESQDNMLKKLELTSKELLTLKRYCQKKGIIFLVTPFDEVSLKELEKIGMSAYKVSSTDVTNLLFLKNVAQRCIPIFLSTGMAYLEEVVMALKEIHPYNKNVILLQCTSNYPVSEQEVNLRVIPHFSRQFKIIVGYSDHTVGIKAIPYAVALGAKVIEKHFTIDRSLPGPDHRASLSPGQLKRVIQEVRKAEKYLGTSVKEPTPSELEVRKYLSKHLVAARNIQRGTRFTEDLITAKRTGGLGIPAIEYKKILNKRAAKKYKKDEIITG
jgi:N,N'-diacetyllegionaminate synthase